MAWRVAGDAGFGRGLFGVWRKVKLHVGELELACMGCRVAMGVTRLA